MKERLEFVGFIVFVALIVAFIIIGLTTYNSDYGTEKNKEAPLQDRRELVPQPSRTSYDMERDAAISIKAKMEKLVVEMAAQSRKLKAAGYTAKQIEDANYKLLENAHNTWTDAEKQAFYKAATKAFRSLDIERLKSRPSRTSEKPIRINKDKVRADENNIVNTYEYKPLYPTAGVSEHEYEEKISENFYWPYYNEYDLRMRIKDSSTIESIIYKAAKNVQLYPSNKTVLRNWSNILGKYEPLLGEYRFYAIMMMGYKDGRN